MNFQYPRRALPFALALIGATALATPSLASAIAPTTVPFTEALIVSHSPGAPSSSFPVTVERHRQVGSTAPSASSVAESNVADEEAWGFINGSASADLATGQLRARSQVLYNGSDDGIGIYHQVNAFFGDGFRTSDATGSPFSWQQGSTARFSLDVDGFVGATPGLESLGAGAFVLLGIYEAGALPDPEGNITTSAGLLSYFLYTIGNPNLNLRSCNTTGTDCTSLIPSRYLGNLNGSTTVVQDFQPGADFDWVLLVGASGQLAVPGNWDMDLGHTVTFNYEGPTDSTTASVSGLFNNFSVPPGPSVPEPASVLLIGFAALAGAGLGRRRRS